MRKTKKVYKKNKTSKKRHGGTKVNTIKVPYRISGTPSALSLRNAMLKKPKTVIKYPKGLSAKDAIEANRRRRKLLNLK